MTIVEYLDDCKFASRKLLEAVWDDFANVRRLTDEISVETKLVNKEYDRALAMQRYAEDPDDVMDGVGRYWENYFGPAKELYSKDKKLVDLTALLAARELSLCQLCGALLEQVKRGLSIVYGAPATWPGGRLLGTQQISLIILAARNQSAHLDEAIRDGQYKNAKITNCFNKLNMDFANIFANFLTRDMSFEIVKLFDWTSYEKFRNDVEDVR